MVVSDVPRGAAAGNELESWMEWIETTFAQQDDDNLEIDDLENFVGGKRLLFSYNLLSVCPFRVNLCSDFDDDERWSGVKTKISCGSKTSHCVLNVSYLAVFCVR